MLGKSTCSGNVLKISEKINILSQYVEQVNMFKRHVEKLQEFQHVFFIYS